MTPREEEVFNFICAYIKTNHYAPSIRDVAKGLYMSVTVAKKHLNRLVEKQYLLYTPKIARSYFPNEERSVKDVG